VALHYRKCGWVAHRLRNARWHLLHVEERTAPRAATKKPVQIGVRMKSSRFSFLLVLLLAFVAGCSSGMGAIVDTLRYAVVPGRDIVPQLNPAYDFLRVTAQGRIAYMARGSAEQTPEGRIDVWYSGDREVMRLRDGRLVGMVGTTTEWRRVVVPSLPDWREVAKGPVVHWTRIRDVMPGYRMGIGDALTLRRTSAPKDTALVRLDADQYTWFEESSQGTDLPPARYAVDLRGAEAVVVYAEQCLSSNFCVSWQRWQIAQSSSDR